MKPYYGNIFFILWALEGKSGENASQSGLQNHKGGRSTAFRSLNEKPLGSELPVRKPAPRLPFAAIF